MTITKGNLATPVVNVSEDGLVSWNAISLATSYRAGLNESTVCAEGVSSGTATSVNMLSEIIASKGLRTVYVCALGNSNYNSAIGSNTVNVHSVTLSGDEGTGGITLDGTTKTDGSSIVKNYIRGKQVAISMTPKTSYLFDHWQINSGQ